MMIQRQCQSSITSQLCFDIEAERSLRNQRIGCWTVRARRLHQLRGTSWRPEPRRWHKLSETRALYTVAIELHLSIAILKSLTLQLPCWDASSLELLLCPSTTCRTTNA